MSVINQSSLLFSTDLFAWTQRGCLEQTLPSLTLIYNISSLSLQERFLFPRTKIGVTSSSIHEKFYRTVSLRNNMPINTTTIVSTFLFCNILSDHTFYLVVSSSHLFFLSSLASTFKFCIERNHTFANMLLATCCCILVKNDCCYFCSVRCAWFKENCTLPLLRYLDYFGIQSRWGEQKRNILEKMYSVATCITFLAHTIKIYTSKYPMPARHVHHNTFLLHKERIVIISLFVGIWLEEPGRAWD